MRRRTVLLLLMTVVLALQSLASDPGVLKLWYDKPAQKWESEALPLGNGRLGCMVFGGVPKEQIQFNEDSLWIGDEQSTGSYQAFGDLFLEFNHSEVSNYRRESDISRAVHTLSLIHI